jgi:hypothetical protein
MPGIVGIKEQYVGLFAYLERAQTLSHAHGVSSIDGDGVERLVRQ